MNGDDVEYMSDLISTMPGHVLVEEIFVRSGAVEPEVPELTERERGTGEWGRVRLETEKVYLHDTVNGSVAVFCLLSRFVEGQYTGGSVRCLGLLFLGMIKSEDVVVRG